MKLNPLHLLRNLVAFNTVNDGVDKRPGRECPEYIVDVLFQFDFDARVLESNGFYTAFGVREAQGPKVLFLAHFDVVPVGDGWNSDPFELKVDGDIAYGRGTCDNKGNIVSMLLMAERLSNESFPCTVMIAASGDEEIGGANGALYLKRWLQEHDLSPDYVVIADGVGQQIVFKRRNALPTTFRIKREQQVTRGRVETMQFTTETFASNSRHSAYLRRGVDRHAFLAASRYLLLNPEVLVKDVRGSFLKTNIVPEWVELDLVFPDGDDEITYDLSLTKMVRALLTISNISFDAKPSRIGTVIWPNLLSLEDDTWTLVCDIRAMTNDKISVKRAFEMNLADILGNVEVSVVSGAGFVNVDVNSHLIRAAMNALERLSMNVVLTEGSGASDSRYFADSAELFDFGPIGLNLHGPNENVSLSSIIKNGEFYYELLRELVK